MAKLHIHTKFTLRHDDGTTTDYAPGEHEFDGALADHWYVKLHARDPNAAPSASLTRDDSKALDAIEADLIAKEQSLAELEAKLKAIAIELEARTSDLDKRSDELDERDEALAAREGDLVARIEAFEASQRAAVEQSSEKASGGQSQQNSSKKR
jgi:hypothetical protein